ncbi:MULTISPECIES: formylglycine-generating enzyme family protein [Photorhabdus]|uniref:Formylglycine-generating enzyme, required for sulfatase activity, contains SUMF1/FGE domain n=1 Tax=Photorhabdus luminescens TaxID=29488 RepID=A0A1G5RLR4_PHOLU|nr:SUMF1/EgtB/PvdO family nonheme iron enzyme [Photorhabdus luminescens]SCZ74331.1 Formylglycine-generating enzyme, required for sulfatase activity, contains SUMF1/FGE domain [Photorhabdus luminescens]
MMKRKHCYPLVAGLVLLTLAGCKDKKKIQTEQQALVKEALAEMVPVEGGSFMMGDFGRRVYEHLPYSLDQDNKPEHKVTLDSFSISKYRVTWGQFNRYREILGLPENDFYQHFKKFGKEYESYQALLGEKYPASVYWQEAKDYCQWLGRVSGEPVDLPTEAQWEYAARSRGQLFIFANNNNVYEPNKNFTGDIRPVGSYPPNPLGLYDMMGNGHDWVNDWYAANYYQYSPEHNPQGPETGKEKVIRGPVGADIWGNHVINRDKRALDYFENPKTNPPGYGFRCAVNLPETKHSTLDLKDSDNREKPAMSQSDKQGVAKS